MAPNMYDRLRASGAHLLISMFLAGLSAAMVFLVWYPAPLSQASGVRDIFLILLAVDISLGPLITLFIFNRKKPELKRDLAIVGLIQLAALLYGMHTVYIARPAYVVFASDRFDLVFANDLDEKKLKEAALPEHRDLPMFGPRIAAAAMPNTVKERTALTFDSVSGGDDLQHLPKYYRPYNELKGRILEHTESLEKLKDLNKARSAEVEQLALKYKAAGKDVGFVPLRGKAKDLAVIVDRATAEVQEIVDLQPWL